jgi:hypothetical protein
MVEVGHGDIVRRGAVILRKMGSTFLGAPRGGDRSDFLRRDERGRRGRKNELKNPLPTSADIG